MSEETHAIILQYLDVILSPVVALVGILVARPILKKKLTENHISASLKDIQQSNLKIQELNQKLINLYKPRTSVHSILSKEEMKAVHDEIQAVYQISLSASSDVSTILFYLKTTLYYSLEDFDRANETILSQKFYDFIIYILEFVNYFSVQAVQIPKSSQTIKEKLVKAELVKYVTHSHIYKYKYFHRGLIKDPKSLHSLRFCEEVNISGIRLLMRSAFLILQHPGPIANLLFFHKIYAPLKLTGFGNVLFTENELALYLIGFTFREEFTKEGNKRSVKLFYSNPHQNIEFTSALRSNNNFLKKASDDYLENSDFSFEGARLTGSSYELLEVTINREYLAEKHKQNKRRIRKKLHLRENWFSNLLFWKC